jgi:hypothetical protein
MSVIQCWVWMDKWKGFEIEIGTQSMWRGGVSHPTSSTNIDISRTSIEVHFPKMDVEDTLDIFFPVTCGCNFLLPCVVLN